ncbi:MAG: hypothetical protein JXR96_27195 [Deltaproteobacteria bacterium]|nr:hypothetical protein [Deltaproteobacteria bacterium]
MSDSSDLKIAFLGGGSTQFAPGLIVDFIHARELYGSRLVLVDVDEEKLEKVFRLGKRLLEAGGADYALSRTSDRREALAGADFVVVSVEVDRFATWEQDRRIPAELGIAQALGENGGPGGLFHALRQIPGVVEICEDAQRLCPEALVLNLSNPMSRVLQAVRDYTGVRFIGLCHEIRGGNEYLCRLLGLPRERLRVVAAGLNHFSWYQEIRDADTGRDLYPEVRARVQRSAEPDRLLVADILRQTGHLSITTDSHVGEYLAGGHVWKSAWAPEVEPLAFFESYKAEIAEIESRMQAVLAGEQPAEQLLEEPSGEIVTEMIERVALGRKQGYDAFNLPNDGLIPNLPAGCIAEVPGWLDGARFGGRAVEPLPPLLAGWCGVQAAIHALNARAAMEGDRRAALEALLLDPVVPDRFTAERCLEAMLDANRAYLPRFFV